MTNDALLSVMPRVQSVTGIANLLDYRARTHGAKEALVCDGARVSFSQLAGRARAISNQLKQHGVKFGDRVGIYLPNGVEFVAAFFAVLGVGGVVVPINPLLKADEITHILFDSQASVLIIHDSLANQALAPMSNSPSLNSVILAGATDPGAASRIPQSLRVDELIKTMATDNGSWPVAIQPETDLGVLVYTSGTTGKPKGAMLTHHNLLSIFPSRLDLFDVDEHDRCLTMLPLCHIYGITVAMVGSIARGATLVIMPKFDAKQALTLMDLERITVLPAVPAMYSMLLSEFNSADYDLSPLRLCFAGGSPSPLGLFPAIEAAFHAPVCEGYALTETACVATLNPLHGVRKAGSAGLPLPGVQIGIFDEAGRMLPTGSEHVGEIGVKGPNVMVGYYKQSIATDESLKDGWFLTGDLGFRDADGYLFIAGRKKELIIRGGMNVYPREIEDAILQLPGVREVAVIGVPDDRMGERVKAIVVRSDAGLSEDLIKQHCTEHLADFKVPRIVEFSDSLPRNSTGKVLKRLLS